MLKFLLEIEISGNVDDTLVNDVVCECSKFACSHT